jgi:hypothetical protein
MKIITEWFRWKLIGYDALMLIRETERTEFRR